MRAIARVDLQCEWIVMSIFTSTSMQCSRRSERDIESPGIRVRDGYELSSLYQKSNQGFPEEQPQL